MLSIHTHTHTLWSVAALFVKLFVATMATNNGTNTLAYLGNISAIRRGSRHPGICSEPDLIVGDDVDGPLAGIVREI